MIALAINKKRETDDYHNLQQGPESAGQLRNGQISKSVSVETKNVSVETKSKTKQNMFQLKQKWFS